MTKCRDRVLRAIRLEAKSASQIAEELFVSRRTAYEVLESLRKEGNAHRKFFHNRRTNRPDYLYCAFKFSARYTQPIQNDPPAIAELVGAWDTIDITRIKE